MTAFRSSNLRRSGCGYGLSCWLLLVAAGPGAGCAHPASRDVEVEVSRIALDPDSHAPVVLLEDKTHTVALPIWVGAAEAQSIANRLAGVEPPRPSTHDLMKTVMDRVGVGLQRVVIRELRDNTYYASVVLLWQGEEVEIDSRPSDAIAMAVRFGQPIFVNRALLEGQGAVDVPGAGAEALSVEGITVQRLSAALAEYFEVAPGEGVVVSSVDAAENAGLRRGDVILAVDGTPVHDPAEFRAKVSGGDGRADLAVQRGGARIHVAFGSGVQHGID